MPRATMDLDSTKFLQSLTRAVAEMHVNANREINELGDHVARSAQAKAPVDTGELKRSIGVGERAHDADGPFVVVEATAAHAAAQEFGARAHIIRSHGDYPLRNRETGQVFGKVVHHPGNKAQPFMRPAIAEETARWRPKIVPDA